MSVSLIEVDIAGESIFIEPGGVAAVARDLLRGGSRIDVYLVSNDFLATAARALEAASLGIGFSAGDFRVSANSCG